MNILYYFIMNILYYFIMFVLKTNTFAGDIPATIVIVILLLGLCMIVSMCLAFKTEKKIFVMLTIIPTACLVIGAVVCIALMLATIM